MMPSLCVYLRGGAGAPHVSSAPTQGHPSPGRSAPPCFAAESVRADTLRALPENAVAPALMYGHSKAPDAQPLSGSPIRGYYS